MPNWGSNLTRIEGPTEDIDVFFEAITNSNGTITMVTNIAPDTDGYGDFHTEVETDGNERTLRYEVPWGPLMDSTWEEISLRFPTLTFDTSYSEWDNLVMGRIVAHNGQIVAHAEVNPEDWPEEPEEPEDTETPEYEEWLIVHQAYMNTIFDLETKMDEEVENILSTTEDS